MYFRAFLGPVAGGALVDKYDFATASSICAVLALIAVSYKNGK